MDPSTPRDLVMRSIGTVRSPHRDPVGTPIQPKFAEAVEGELLIHPSYEAALTDLEGFERIWVLFVFDRAVAYQPMVVPYRDRHPHGTLATRAPSRPNPIGMSVLRVLGRQGCTVRVAGLDILDGTPILDIKPYVPEFDAHPQSRAGWFDALTVDRQAADARFHDGARTPSTSPDQPGRPGRG